MLCQPLLTIIIKENTVYILDSGGCFPSTAKVNLKNGKVVPMSDLKIGDEVQTGTNTEEIKIHIIPLVNLFIEKYMNTNNVSVQAGASYAWS